MQDKRYATGNHQKNVSQVTKSQPFPKWVILHMTPTAQLGYLCCQKHERARAPGTLLESFDPVGQWVEMPIPSEE